MRKQITFQERLSENLCLYIQRQTIVHPSYHLTLTLHPHPTLYSFPSEVSLLAFNIIRHPNLVNEKPKPGIGGRWSRWLSRWRKYFRWRLLVKTLFKGNGKRYRISENRQQQNMLNENPKNLRNLLDIVVENFLLTFILFIIQQSLVFINLSSNRLHNFFSRFRALRVLSVLDFTNFFLSFFTKIQNLNTLRI